MIPFPLTALPLLATAPSMIDAMKWHRRILVVAAPAPADPSLAEQRRQLAGWRSAAADRDLTVVEVIGGHVTGTRDTAAVLRHRYSLTPNRFAALLIGKDGHVVMRESRPIPAATLESTIDAMPMRRAGQR